jgi:3-deoxy-7-phosphoheptulonate synthase
MKPYKLANREFAAENTRVPLGGVVVGGTAVAITAGPCSVEGLDMLAETARHIRAAGAVALTGGAFKPRSSPYSFSGL